jgi:hypothetical protein
MFHVPKRSRIVSGPQATTWVDGNNGAFEFDSPSPGWSLFVICSDGGGWEHVSVHARRKNGPPRIPTWREMCFVKSLFWDPEDVAMQLHPRESEYVNQHPCVLHLWRPTTAVIPTPPSIMVGLRTEGPRA